MLLHHKKQFIFREELAFYSITTNGNLEQHTVSNKTEKNIVFWCDEHRIGIENSSQSILLNKIDLLSFSVQNVAPTKFCGFSDLIAKFSNQKSTVLLRGSYLVFQPYLLQINQLTGLEVKLLTELMNN